MKILITAFEPFGGEPVNPAQEAVALVPDEIAGAQIVKCTVPVVFGKAIETVCAAIDREEPDAVLCIGQAGGRFHLTPEIPRRPPFLSIPRRISSIGMPRLRRKGMM